MGRSSYSTGLQSKIVDSQRLMGQMIKQLEPVELISGLFASINVSRFSNCQCSACPCISEVWSLGPHGGEIEASHRPWK